MDVLSNLASGFAALFDWINLLYMMIGVILGTIIGALPGLGPTSGVALLLPLTFGMAPLPAIILLASIYQGCMYGGRISAILINVPGDAPAIVTAFEGYPMTLKGKAGSAMGISALSSFFGGMFGFLVLAFCSIWVAKFALSFAPPEYFGLMFFGLCAVGTLAGDSPIKGLAMTILGLLFAMVGSDYVSGHIRLTFGFRELWDGIDFLPVVVGIFGLTEVMFGIEQQLEYKYGDLKLKFREMFPTKDELKQMPAATARGSVIGFFTGLLPGAGATVATFLTYAIEKKQSKHPEKFGHGAVEGLAAPEAANNSSVGGALIPLLTLGVPGSGTTAILLGALMMWGMRPGPLLFQEAPDLIWGLIASLLLGNLILLILNTAFIPMFVTILKLIQPVLSLAVTALCIVGVYSLNNSMFDVGMMVFFGIVGYFIRKFDYPSGPLILALILGPMAESSLRQGLIMSGGNINIFFNRPITLILIIVGLLMLLKPVADNMIRHRRNRNIHSTPEN